MKTAAKLLIVLLLVISISSTEAQSRKRVYDEDEISLPNNLQYNSTGKEAATIKVNFENKMVTISWQTAVETNTSHFELQRSGDGTNFEPIETITAGGISTVMSSYATTDHRFDACEGKLFYRVKTVFFNGKEMFTNPVALALAAADSTKTK